MSEFAADERILQAALRRFAADGLSAPLRRVAEDAHVSAGLIIHHYASREKLLEKCDERALAVTRHEKSALFAGGAGELLTQLAQTDQYAPVVGYVLRRLQTGGPLALQLVDDFARGAREYFAEGERLGTITPSRDPEGRAEVLTHMALGSLVLQLPAQQDRLDIAELPTWLRRYTERFILPLLELYSVPLLTDRTMLDAYLAAQDDGRTAAGRSADDQAHDTDHDPPTAEEQP